MKQKHKKTIVLNSILGIIYFIVAFIFYQHFGISDWKQLLFWSVLAIVAESFVVVSSAGTSTSVGTAIYLYAAVLGTPLDVMLVVTLGVLLCIPEINDKRRHILNTPLYKMLFNVFNISLSMGLASVFFKFYQGDFNIVVYALVMFVVLAAEELINGFILYQYFSIQLDDIKARDILKDILGSYLNSIAIGTLGIFLVFADYTYGKSIVIILFIPILLARYSFKLYYDSQRMAIDTIHALNEALHAKDAYTGGHTGRVQQYAMDIAKAYKLTSHQIDTIDKAALLHDIGKIGIPDDILNKNGKLTDEEYRRIQEHATIGGHIIGSVHSLRKISLIIIQHHERYDGKGYPNQLSGDQISIEAAILMIADSFDAMTSDRPYRKAYTKEYAIKELIENAGIQFHPKVVKCFVEEVLSQPGYNVGDATAEIVEIDQVLEAQNTSERAKEA